MQFEILPFTYYKIPTTDEVIHEIKVKVENGKFVLYEENGIDLFTEKFVIGATYRFEQLDPSNSGHLHEIFNDSGRHSCRW